ncbi:MAG: lysylphosphatidylglycerol synthase domain-containing protein [Acidimicrobiales bacterium]
MTDAPDLMTSDHPSLAKRLLRVGIFIAVLVLVFGWLLPQIVDYDLIADAITGLTWEQLAVLLLLSLLRVPTEAMVYRAMLPGLRLIAGSGAYLSSNVAANFMPPPASSIVQYAYFRAEGFESSASMTGAVGSFVFPQGGRIVLPIVAFVVLLLAGAVDTEALVITAVAVVIVAVVVVIIRKIGQSEQSARWVGAKLAAIASWVLVKFGKEPVDDLGDQVVDFRDNAYAVVRDRWAIGSIAVALNLLITYLILVAALRAVDVDQSQLGLVAIFACFAVAFFAGVVIPITGSGLGVVDVVMVSSLSASATSGVDVNIIVAAVVLWRVFYGILAIIPGALTLTLFTRANRDLLSEAAGELRGDDDES